MSQATSIIDRTISPADNLRIRLETGYDLKALLKARVRDDPLETEGLMLDKKAYKKFMSMKPEQKSAEIRSFIGEAEDE
jgi:hypothetical protein